MEETRFAGGRPPIDEGTLTAVYDELPLWSAPFGLRLLETVRLRAGLTALDVGCGAGFPLIELAQRLGPTGHVHGVDPWGAALARVRQKLAVYGVENVTLHEGGAEHLPLPDASVGLVVSNNGLNNIDRVEEALAECARVARPEAQLVYCYNLPESMREFYDSYDALLADRNLAAEREALRAHILARRKPLATTRDLLDRAGFEVVSVREESFRMRFLDAGAMFAHFFIRLAFLPPWLEILAPPLRAPLFLELEERLNDRARQAGELALTVPFACLDCRRRSETR